MLKVGRELRTLIYKNVEQGNEKRGRFGCLVWGSLPASEFRVSPTKKDMIELVYARPGQGDGMPLPT